MDNRGFSDLTSDLLSGVGRKFHTIGWLLPQSAVLRRIARRIIGRLIARATREYGNGRTTGEYTRRLSGLDRPWPCPRPPPRSRRQRRGRSRGVGARTPVDSTKSTRFPCAASADMICWCPCHRKSQSIEERHTTVRSRSITAHPPCNSRYSSSVRRAIRSAENRSRATT